MFKPKKIISILALGLVVVTLIPIQPAEGLFAECTTDTACFFKDVYDNAAKVWKTDTVNAVPGDYINFNLGFWNKSQAVKANVTFTDTLPSQFTYVPGSMNIAGFAGAYNENDLFTDGINVGTVASQASVQVRFMVRINELAAGNFTITNTGNVAYASGSATNNANVVVTSTGPVAGKVAINEINFNPKADWSDSGEYRLSGRTAINSDDQFIELYIKNNGLNLTSADWQMFIDNGSANSTTQLLAAGSSFQYISTTGGTQTNTKTGDYVLINNPLLNLDGDSTVRVSYLSTSMDEIAYATTNTNLLDETLGRNAASLDTDNTSDFSKNHGTPGRANTARVDNTYEAEIYAGSSTGNEHSVDIFDAGASEGIATEYTPGLDLAGVSLDISDTNTAAGSYRIKLRAKVTGATSGQLLAAVPQKIGEFFFKYPNPSDKQTGFFELGLNNFRVNDTYKEFVINVTKPATGSANSIWFEFDPVAAATGWKLIIDKITIESISIMPAASETLEAENFYAKAAIPTTDGGVGVMRSLASDVNDVADFDSVVSYNYTANQLDGNTNRRYRADYYIKFANVPAGNASDIVATMETRNHFGFANGLSGVKNVTRLEAAGHTPYAVISYEFTSDTFGSYQHRVLSRGIADIYLDKVVIVPIAAPTSFTYEAEDLEFVKGGSSLYKPCAIVADAAASQGYATSCTTASIAAGNVQTGPFSYAQSDGAYYKALFRIKAGEAVNQNSLTSVAAVSANFLPDGGGVVILAKKVITEGMLSQTAFRDFGITFKVPTGGRIVYSVHFYDSKNIIIDKTTVNKLGADPTVETYQSEELIRFGGNPNFADATASNVWGLGTGVSITGVNGTDQHKMLAAMGPFEKQEAGNYTAKFFLKKAGTVGNNGAEFVLIRVTDVAGNTLATRTVLENELDTDFTGSIDVNFSNPSEQYMFYKVKFIASPLFTTSNVEFDKVELNKI